MDPLLRLTQQVCDQTTDTFCETVATAPVFLANTAIQEDRTSLSALRSQEVYQRLNALRIEEATRSSSWNVVPTDESVRAGIVLLRPSKRVIGHSNTEGVRAQFRDRGITLSAYCDGIVRISVPSTPMRAIELESIRMALNETAPTHMRRSTICSIPSSTN